MATTAPQALAIEFERLAQTWAQLADDLERAQTTSESSLDPMGEVEALRRA